MQLIPDWRAAPKWFSVQALAAITALPVVWATLPSDVKAYIPDGWEPWVFVALGAAGLIGRLIPQGSNVSK